MDAGAGVADHVNSVIAAAFKAAGLPSPAVTPAARRTPASIAPGAIIEAALKAAGLKK